MEFSYLDNLVSGDEASFEHAWGLFINDFLNAVPMVREELRQAVVVKAEVWKGSGIGQAQLSRFIYQWTGVRIMTSDWSKYRDIVVCALALYYRLLNVPKDLSNEFADAAFKLCDKLERVNEDKDEKDDEKKPVAMPWDAAHVPLPPSLVDSFRKTRVAMDGAEKGRLLKDVPFVLDIPHYPQRRKTTITNPTRRINLTNYIVRGNHKHSKPFV